MDRPLAGIRVTDLTRHIAGPFCASLLADMGADVIKVESMDGDESRRNPQIHKGESLFFISFNRNKRAVTLNLRSDKGKDVLRKLIAMSDVVVENYRPGVMEEMGLDYENLKKIKKDIILTSISGWGQNGPYARRPGFDFIGQAMAGLMDLTGFPDGAPVRAGANIGDYVTSLYGALATCAALRQRETTGEGQWVESALMDCLVSFEGPFLTRYGVTGEIEKRVGDRSYFGAPNNIYKASDGWGTIVTNADYLYHPPCRAMGREDLIDDPRFKTRPVRASHVEEIDAEVQGWIEKHTQAELSDIFVKYEVPFGLVQDMGQVYNDPQIKAREMVIESDHPVVGKVPVLGSAMKFSGSKFEVKHPAPLLGQHNQDVYGGILGFSEDEIAKLTAEGT